MTIGKYIKGQLDFQRFERNPDLDRIIANTKKKYGLTNVDLSNGSMKKEAFVDWQEKGEI